MKVLKFGGTSVGSVEIIRKVVEILQKYYNGKDQVAVVFSAMSGVTNELLSVSSKASESDSTYQTILKAIEERHIQAVKALIDVKVQSKVIANIKILINELEDLLNGVFLLKELSLRTQDLVLSFGERLSTYILSEYIRQSGIACDFLDARTLIKTDNNFSSAKINFSKTDKNISEYFAKNKNWQIVTGFISSTDKNETTTLGRGGSDYTASVLGAALGAEEIEIWTDVDGVMTADPRKVKQAFTLPAISYVEAMEMSHFGAKVIYPPTLQPAFNKKIAIRIKNTFNPEFEGTLISAETQATDFMIKGISSIQDVALMSLQGSGMVGVPGVSARLFGSLAKQKINVILITQASSEYSICFAIEPKDADRASLVIEEEFEIEIHTKKIEKVHVEMNRSIVAIIGDNMRNTPGISGKLFSALGKNGINVVAIAQGSSELNLSVVIPQNDLSKALNALHESFFLSDIRSINLFVVGIGLIGGTLLKQIANQSAYLLKERLLRINIIAIGNSKKMLFAGQGLDISSWSKQLDEAKEKMDLDAFVQKMRELNLPNSVFVDCTSSKDVITHYEDIIRSSISIVTPNKLA
ncbi:MAG TPA: aspartate kinase, partial [Cytophagaceae bacterium]